MAISAAFTINATSVPAAVSVAYGGGVTLALSSITGVESVQFSIVGTSGTGVSAVALTPAGTPTGSQATATMPADPGDGLGRAYLVRCLVSNQYESAEAYGIFGATNEAGIVPLTFGEELARHATGGWIDVINQIAKVANDRIALLTKSGTSFTFALADAGRWNQTTNGAAVTATVPNSSTVAFPVGSVITIEQNGAGQVTFSPAGGVTIQAYLSATKTAAQYAVATLTYKGSNVWNLSGQVV